MSQDTATLAELAEKVSISVKDGAHRAWDKQDDWQREANSYRVTLGYQGRRMSLDFWQGTGCEDEPTAAGVLECILSDADLGQYNFEDFCSGIGSDPDSRKAFASWRQCQSLRERLMRLLGDDFETFLYAER